MGCLWQIMGTVFWRCFLTFCSWWGQKFFDLWKKKCRSWWCWWRERRRRKRKEGTGGRVVSLSLSLCPHPRTHHVQYLDLSLYPRPKPNSPPVHQFLSFLPHQIAVFRRNLVFWVQMCLFNKSGKFGQICWIFCGYIKTFMTYVFKPRYKRPYVYS